MASVRAVSATHSGRLQALVVEDEPAIAQAARAWLEDLGFAVTVAATADEGLSAVGLFEFDLMLADIVTPGELNGRELAFETARLQPAIAVVLSSGFSIGVATSGGPFGPILRKPYGKTQLERAVSRVIALTEVRSKSVFSNPGMSLERVS